MGDVLTATEPERPYFAVCPDDFLRLVGERETVHPYDVAAFSHETRESAQAAIDGNRDLYGHPHSWGPVEHGGRWVEAVDLRPALAKHNTAPRDPSEPHEHSRGCTRLADVP